MRRSRHLHNIFSTLRWEVGENWCWRKLLPGIEIWWLISKEQVLWAGFLLCFCDEMMMRVCVVEKVILLCVVRERRVSVWCLLMMRDDDDWEISNKNLMMWYNDGRDLVASFFFKSSFPALIPAMHGIIRSDITLTLWTLGACWLVLASFENRQKEASFALSSFSRRFLFYSCVHSHSFCSLLNPLPPPQVTITPALVFWPFCSSSASRLQPHSCFLLSHSKQDGDGNSVPTKFVEFTITNVFIFQCFILIDIRSCYGSVCDRKGNFFWYYLLCGRIACHWLTDLFMSLWTHMHVMCNV